MNSDFHEWRRKIDQIDLELVRLLNERSRYAIEIGKIKKKKKLPVWTPDREAEILAHVEGANRGPLDNAAIRRLFERIIDEARSLERHARGSAAPGGAGEGELARKE